MCFRTQVAVRIPFLETQRWEQYVLGQLFESRREETLADITIVEGILLPLYHEAKETIRHVGEEMKREQSFAWTQVLQRWKQVERMTWKAFLCTKQEVQDDLRERFMNKCST